MRYLRDLTQLLIQDRKQVRFLLIFGIIVGCLVGLIGSLFQLSIEKLTTLKMDWLATLPHHGVLAWLIPIGFSTLLLLFAMILVKVFAPEAAGSGVQEIEGVLADKRRMRWHRILPVKFFAGICALSSGMVLGREGPTIQIGGAIGKMLSDRFGLTSEYAHILIAAGAGAGLAAAFNAPLAGILFVVEEMRTQFKYNFISLQCVIVAAIFSDIVLRIFMGQGNDIPMTHLHAPPLASLWIFIIFGCIFGIMGVIFNRCLVKSLNIFTSVRPILFWISMTVIGIVVGILTKIYPEIIGGGYVLIPQALHYQIAITPLLVIFIARLFSTWISYGSGAPGGIFAPMLALGTTFGMWFGHYAHQWFPNLIVDPTLFAVAGMSALFTATVGAPLTGIVLVVEMTMNYAMILPLILTCFSATIMAYLLGGFPIYEVLLERTLRLAKAQKA